MQVFSKLIILFICISIVYCSCSNLEDNVSEYYINSQLIADTIPSMDISDRGTNQYLVFTYPRGNFISKYRILIGEPLHRHNGLQYTFKLDSSKLTINITSHWKINSYEDPDKLKMILYRFKNKKMEFYEYSSLKTNTTFYIAYLINERAVLKFNYLPDQNCTGCKSFVKTLIKNVNVVRFENQEQQKIFDNYYLQRFAMDSILYM